MGNCIKKESSMHWGGEDWSSATSESHENGYGGYSYGKVVNGIEEDEEEDGLLGKNNKKAKFCPFDSNTGTEVKIKITKKQLEELVSRADLEGMSIQQVLAKLMNVGDKFDTHQRSWRPALQSIPEAEVN